MENISITVLMSYIKYAIFKLMYNNIPLTLYSLENELDALINSYTKERIIELVDEITENLNYY